MKKISNTEIASLIVIQTVTLYSGINFNIIKNSNSVNCWFTILLADIISIIPLLMYLYIAKYKPNLKLNEKINHLYNKIGWLINIILNLIILTIGITLLYNVNNFITSQLLYRTPQIAISILLMSIIVYHCTKGIDSICKVSIIMTSLNLILFLIGFFSLAPNISFDSFLPFLKEDTTKIIPCAIKLASLNSLPIILTLIIPKNESSNPSKYNKSIVIGYIVGIITSFIIAITVVGVLGIYLTNIFEYPEYIVLKKISLLGSIERIENILAGQWIVGNYIYLSLIVYYLSDTFILKKYINHRYIKMFYGIILILLSSIIFKNNTLFHFHINNIFPYIVMSIFLIYIIIILKIFIENIRKKPQKI